MAQAGSTQRRKKKKLPKTSLRQAARVPAILLRVLGGASVPVHRPSAPHSSCMKRQVRTVHTLQVCGDFTGAAFEQVVDVPVVVRQGSGLDAQTTVEVPQLPSLSGSSSSWTRSLTCPLLCSVLTRWSMSLLCRCSWCRRYSSCEYGRRCDHAVTSCLSSSGSASDSVHRRSLQTFQFAAETGTHSANCATFRRLWRR